MCGRRIKNISNIIKVWFRFPPFLFSLLHFKGKSFILMLYLTNARRYLLFGVKIVHCPLLLPSRSIRKSLTFFDALPPLGTPLAPPQNTVISSSKKTRQYLRCLRQCHHVMTTSDPLLIHPPMHPSPVSTYIHSTAIFHPPPPPFCAVTRSRSLQPSPPFPLRNPHPPLLLLIYTHALFHTARTHTQHHRLSLSLSRNSLPPPTPPPLPHTGGKLKEQKNLLLRVLS